MVGVITTEQRWKLRNRGGSYGTGAHPVLAAKKSKERAVWQMAKVGSE